MKVIVAVKRVIDFNVRVRVKADCSGVETAQVKMAMNPFDEIALEAALRLKEQGIATEIIAVSLGDVSCQETLRTALAFGADRALLVQTTHELQPLAVAKLLQQVVNLENPGVVLMGKQAIDDDCNQTGQMLAGLLNWPQATFISALKINQGYAEVTREVDAGLEMLKIKLPAIITTDLRLNQPRYISLPNIMKSKQKEITTINAQDLPVDITSRLKIIKVEPPAVRKMGIKVNSVQELVEKLRNEAKVIN